MNAAENKVPVSEPDGRATSEQAIGKLLVAGQRENLLAVFLKNLLDVPSAMPERPDLNRPRAAGG